MVKTWIAQAYVSNFLFEDLYRVTPPKLIEVESQMEVYEVTVRMLEPMDYRIIEEEANAWGEYISRPVGPT